jgi:ABC-type uncharacterized transport system involved in gliding motility auxiliary subunit
MNKNLKIFLYIFIAFVLFFSLNIISSLTLNKSKADLTADQMFSLSKATKQIVKNMEEPVTLHFFFSNKIASGIPVIKSYAARIRGLLEEYQSLAGDKITVKYIDPEPFSENEDLAASYAIKGVDIDQNGTKAYLGMAATNSTDGMRIIPLFTLEREKFLEYDITKSIYDLSHLKRKKIGILSSIKMGTTPLMGIPGMGGGSWLVVEQLRQTFDIEELPETTDKIPDGIAVLMVVQPKNFNDATLYAIDQFIMRGGNAMVFVDPNKEGVGTGNPDDRGFSPHFNLMLESWGVDINPETIVADRDAATKTENAPGKNDTPALDNIISLSFGEKNINRDDVTTGSLKTINMTSAGSIDLLGVSGVNVTPLIKSNLKAMKIPVAKIRPLNSTELLRDFVPDGKEYILAARITGKIRSAFPEKDGLKKTKENANIVLVADSDILTDELWAKSQDYQGIKMVTTISDNSSFVVNTIDNLNGTNDLIALRGRGAAKHPFTRLEHIQKAAEDKYLAKEAELKNKLADTESRLASLQNMAKMQAGNAVEYKNEQQVEIKKFSEDMVKTKKELRKVRSELRTDIESLGTKLKFINIWLMPLLITLFALFMGLMKNIKLQRRNKVS